MSVAQHDTASPGRGAPNFTGIAGPLRLYLGVFAVLVLVALAAMDVGGPQIRSEAAHTLSTPDSEPLRFDGRGKWSGYAR